MEKSVRVTQNMQEKGKGKAKGKICQATKLCLGSQE